MSERAELLRIIELAQKSGNKQMELEVIRKLDSLSEGVATAPRPGPPPTTQMSAFPEGSQFTPDPLDTAEPTLSQQVFEPGVQMPRDQSFSTAASLIAVPATALKATGVAPKILEFVKQSLPQIFLGAAGGGFGSAADEKQEGGDVLDMLSSFKEGAKEFGLAEVQGALAGGVLSGALNRMFPGIDEASMLKKFPLEDPAIQAKRAKRAVKFAQETGAPISLSQVQAKGMGPALKKLADKTFFGDFVRRAESRKVNTFLSKKIRQLTPGVRLGQEGTEEIVQKTSGFFDGLFTKAKDAKELAYKQLAAKVPEGLTVKANNIFLAAQTALDLSVGSKASSTPAGKRMLKQLQEIATQPGRLRSFDNLDQLRKNFKSYSANRDLNEAAKGVFAAIEGSMENLSKKANVDFLSEIKIAETAFKELDNIKKIPGLRKFSSYTDAKKYIGSLFNRQNIPALKVLSKQNPELYQELLSTKLDMTMRGYMKDTGIEGTPIVFEGAAFHDWYLGNKKFIDQVFGRDRSQAIENFAKYTRFIDRELKQVRGDTALTMKTISKGVGKGAAEIFAASQAPWLVGAAESIAPIIANRLTNPNSEIFKIFMAKNPEALNLAIQKGMPMAFKAASPDFGGMPQALNDMVQPSIDGMTQGIEGMTQSFNDMVQNFRSQQKSNEQ